MSQLETETEALAEPVCYLSDGGDVYFLREGVSYYAPVMIDGSFGMDDAAPVGFGTGISEENGNYCAAIAVALKLLKKRNIADGMPVENAD